MTAFWVSDDKTVLEVEDQYFYTFYNLNICVVSTKKLIDLSAFNLVLRALIFVRKWNRFEKCWTRNWIPKFPAQLYYWRLTTSNFITVGVGFEILVMKRGQKMTTKEIIMQLDGLLGEQGNPINRYLKYQLCEDIGKSNVNLLNKTLNITLLKTWKIRKQSLI